MASDKIIIKGAREHNLKNIDLEIPRDKFVVFTGVSGSGKSSLAFDTIYAEGQRRYVESLSAYARQFLGQMEKPDVDGIEGLSPAISIDQKTTSHNPRSTVGTVTEIYDYLRLLYARVGTPHCYKCGKEIRRQTIDQIVDQICALPEGTRLQLMAPVVRRRKGEHQKVLDEARRNGYVRARVDGEIRDLSEEIKLEKTFKHSIEIVVDRLVVKEGIQQRLTESIETASALTGGVLLVDAGGEELKFSQHFSCPDCGVSMDEIEPSLFSFNNPAGACPDCSGLGVQMKFDPELVVPNPNLTLLEGAISVPGWNNVSNDGSATNSIFVALAKKYKFDLKLPFAKLPEKVKNLILYGTNGEKLEIKYISNGSEKYYSYDFEGVINSLYRRYRDTTSDWMRQEYEGYMTNIKCPTCDGKKLRPEVLAVTIGGKSITAFTDLPIKDAKGFIDKLELSERKKMIAALILKEIEARLGFLVNVGLDYLTLSRLAGTLSGGESQRIRLATQIGSGLVGVVYILDEPSIGLHQRDNQKLLKTLTRLRDLGNSLIVVEHDEETMYAADCIVDIGPFAGANGGEVVCVGNVDKIKKSKKSETGAYLSGRKKIGYPPVRRAAENGFIEVKGATENNLKNVDAAFPLGVLTCVTGVSGSGKSSLVNEILYKYLAKELNRAKIKAGGFKEITGAGKLNKVINIDQSPIGRTPRSNPATYTGLFDLIRDLFSQTPEAKMRGYQKGRFSFNVKGGRCEACAGDGIIKIEMHFLPDVYVPCEVCHGARYNRETLEVKYKGKTVSDVLNMTVEECVPFFEHLPRISAKIKTLNDVGLSYIKIGQSSTTLSGGEAQRVKLATELSRRSNGDTLYILDEPTTGLHTSDVHKLIDILQTLTESGNTVVVIEHNMDVIKNADYIIDLGPEGGDMGGEIIAFGTPEEVSRNKRSYTAEFLRKVLQKI